MPTTKSGKSLEAPVSVRVIVVGRPCGHSHSDDDDNRRDHVAGELEPRGDHRGGVCEHADDDIAAGEKSADAYAGDGDAAASPVRLIDARHRIAVFSSGAADASSMWR